MIKEDNQPAIETKLNTDEKDNNPVFKKELIIKGSILVCTNYHNNNSCYILL